MILILCLDSVDDDVSGEDPAEGPPGPDEEAQGPERAGGGRLPVLGL